MASDERKDANESFDLQGNIPLTRARHNSLQHVVEVSYLKWLYDQNYAHQENIVQLREYYYGEQESLLTDRQRIFLEVGHDIKFRLNAMSIPVDMSERMRVIGFDVVGDDNKAKPQAGDNGIIWQWWQQSRMDAHQINSHKWAWRDGDSFAIVGWDADKKIPAIHTEQAFDGTSGVIVSYSAEDRTKIQFAAKRWAVDSGGDAGKKTYLTVYTDSTIEYYVGSVGCRDWQPLPDEDGEHVKAWVNPSTGEPLGVTVFHNENNNGRSELEDLIAPQNALDKAVIDEIGLADSAGFPMNYATGLAVGDDPAFGPGTFNSTTSVDAKFGQLAAGDISQLSALVEKWVTRIAQISKTPLQFFQTTGQVARADTQKAGDSPLVSKVTARAKVTGNFWEDVMYQCRKLHNAFGDGPEYDDLIISTVWDSFESIDVQAEDRQKAETAGIKAETFSQLLEDNPNADRAELAELAGYSPDEAAILSAPSQGFIDDGLTQ